MSLLLNIPNIGLYMIILGALILIILGFLFFRYPVRRDRLLFGSSPLWMVGLSVLLIFACVFIIGGIGELFNNVTYDEEKGPIDYNPNAWWLISQFFDPGNLNDAYVKSRGWALFSAILGIVLVSGLFVSSFVNTFANLTEKWRSGRLHYNRCFNKYVIIIGVNQQTATLVKRSLRRRDVKYVLIQTRQNVEAMRQRLDLDLNNDEEKRIVMYFAERTSWEDIECLHPEKAVEIYILGEDADLENEKDHDAFNIKCLENISSCLKTHKSERKRCHVSLEYQSTITAFKSTNIYRDLDKVVEFIPFNVYEIWAKKVLVENFAIIPTRKKGELQFQSYLPLDSPQGISYDSTKTVHLIILGMNSMGTALATQAALLAHYPNFNKDHRYRTTITFIDDRGVVEGAYYRSRFSLLFELSRYREVIEPKTVKDIQSTEWIDPMNTGRFRHLRQKPDEESTAAIPTDGRRNFMDIQWEFIQANVASQSVRDYLSEACDDQDRYTTIAVCFTHSQRAIATSVYLPEKVYRNALQILVYQKSMFDLVTKIEGGENTWKLYEKLRPFGMIERSYTESPFDNSGAKLLHYFYYKDSMSKYREGLKDGKYSAPKDLSEYDEVKIDARLVKEVNDLWAQQDMLNKLSNIDMIDSISTKLRSIGLTVNNIEEFDQRLKADSTAFIMLAQAEHNRWLTERLLLGFRPLEDTEDEWRYFAKRLNEEEKNKAEERKKKKGELKQKLRAHLDICSAEAVAVIDPDTQYNDLNVISHIPQIINYSQWINVFKMAVNTSVATLQQSFFADSANLAIRPVKIDKVVDTNTPTSESKDQSVKAVSVNTESDTTDKESGADKNKKVIWIMDTDVTQLQWRLVTGTNPSPEEYRRDNMPIINVSKEDIDNFISMLCKKTGLIFDLPTKDEWKSVAEKCTPYLPYKEILPLFNKWFGKICFSHNAGPVAVRHYRYQQQNNYKVYDIVGNVWEWTKQEKENNTGNYYCCGGSWRTEIKECDFKNKYTTLSDFASTSKADDRGFRLVWSFDISHLKEEDRREVIRIVKILATSTHSDFNKWVRNLRNKVANIISPIINEIKKVYVKAKHGLKSIWIKLWPKALTRGWHKFKNFLSNKCQYVRNGLRKLCSFFCKPSRKEIERRVGINKD